MMAAKFNTFLGLIMLLAVALGSFGGPTEPAPSSLEQVHPRFVPTASITGGNVTCFWPNGEPAPVARPCLDGFGNPTGLCCAYGHHCLNNSLCMVKGGLGTSKSNIDNGNGNDNGKNSFYRGACTDPEWKNPGCPGFCTGLADNEKSHFIMAHLCGQGPSRTHWFCDGFKPSSNCLLTNGHFALSDNLTVYATAKELLKSSDSDGDHSEVPPPPPQPVPPMATTQPAHTDHPIHTVGPNEPPVSTAAPVPLVGSSTVSVPAPTLSKPVPPNESSHLAPSPSTEALPAKPTDTNPEDHGSTSFVPVPPITTLIPNPAESDTASHTSEIPAETSTFTELARPTSTPNTLTTGVGIGLGVGIVATLLCIGVIALTIYLRRRRKLKRLGLWGVPAAESPPPLSESTRTTGLRNGTPTTDGFGCREERDKHKRIAEKSLALARAGFRVGIGYEEHEMDNLRSRDPPGIQQAVERAQHANAQSNRPGSAPHGPGSALNGYVPQSRGPPPAGPRPGPPHHSSGAGYPVVCPVPTPGPGPSRPAGPRPGPLASSGPGYQGNHRSQGPVPRQASYNGGPGQNHSPSQRLPTRRPAPSHGPGPVGLGSVHVSFSHGAVRDPGSVGPKNNSHPTSPETIHAQEGRMHTLSPVAGVVFNPIRLQEGARAYVRDQAQRGGNANANAMQGQAQDGHHREHPHPDHHQGQGYAPSESGPVCDRGHGHHNDHDGTGWPLA